MSQIGKQPAVAGAVLAVLLLAAGCSDPRQGSFDPDRGTHVSGWLPRVHVSAATAGTTSMGAPVYAADTCSECHGTDLGGGISMVSCTSCHLGGPTAVHPAAWVPLYLTHGPAVSSGAVTTAACANQYCHGTNLQGVANSGPSCTTCHSIPFDPATLVCGACHSIPPDGTQFPDIAGKHGSHATANHASCNICHNGASSYAGDHHNNVLDLSFLPAYAPKSGGMPAFDGAAKTCSNISCHGGPRTQTLQQAVNGQSTLAITPGWYSGTIDVNSQCTSCHVYGTAEFNSYHSGRHFLHVWDPNDGPSPKLGCTVCHDPAALATVHFTHLDTTALEGPPSATLRSALHYSGGSCSPEQGGLSGCHGRESW